MDNKNNKKNYTKLVNRYIEDIGIFYLYFLCVFLEKTFNKLKCVDLDTHKNIEFTEYLPDDFKKKCEEMEIVSTETIYDYNTYKNLDTNFCKRFIYVLNKMYIDEPNFSEIRKCIFEDIKYLSHFFFGIMLTERSVYIEPIIEYFDDIIYKLKNNKINSTLFIINEQNPERQNNVVNEYLDCQLKYESPKDDDKTLYDYYIDAKIELDKRINKYNDDIGYRLTTNLLNPYLLELMTLSQTCFTGLNNISNKYIGYFYQNLQNGFLLIQINKLVNVKNINDVMEIVGKNSYSNFISKEDMEKLIKNE